MKIKLLVSAACTLIASQSLATKDPSFVVNLNQLDPAAYVQLGPNEFQADDASKSVLVSYGMTGLNNHIQYLEEQLKQMQNSDQTWSEDLDGLEQMVADYEQLLAHKAHIENQPMSQKSLTKPQLSACYPSLQQNHNFVFNIMHAVGLSVESHYPLVPGPFPPIQQTTIRAQSQLTAVDAYGTTFSDKSGSQFIGSNVSSGTTTANSLVYPINPFSSTITWRAASFMMQPNCFESIIASGTL